MKSQIIVIVIAILLLANILFSRVNVVNAAVICVDKYNYASVIPCSDQNAIAAPTGSTPGVNMTANMLSRLDGFNATEPCQPWAQHGTRCPGAASGNTNFTGFTGNMTATGNMTMPTTSPTVVASPPLVPTQQQGWTGTCSTLQPLLLQSCSELVNPDGTLTTQGDRAVGCIRNGLIIAVGGISQSLPLPVIIGGLKILEAPTGCGNIVNWDQIQSIEQLQMFSHLFGR